MTWLRQRAPCGALSSRSSTLFAGVCGKCRLRLGQIASSSEARPPAANPRCGCRALPPASTASQAHAHGEPCERGPARARRARAQRPSPRRAAASPALPSASSSGLTELLRERKAQPPQNERKAPPLRKAPIPRKAPDLLRKLQVQRSLHVEQPRRCQPRGVWKRARRSGSARASENRSADCRSPTTRAL